jgi:hypothetical protein
LDNGECGRDRRWQIWCYGTAGIGGEVVEREALVVVVQRVRGGRSLDAIEPSDRD